MKKYSILSLIMFLAIGISWAQYDDMYYDPDKFSDRSYSSRERHTREDRNNQSQQYSDYSDYDDTNYDYFEDNSYYYASRIRRFNRPVYGFDYFDPFYVDAYYYDPSYAGRFFNTGTTVLIYDNPYSYASFRGWNRWNTFYNPYRFSPFGVRAYDPFWNYPVSPWRNAYGFNSFNSFGGGFGGFNSFGGGALYCPPSWGSGYNYNTIATGNNNTRINNTATYYGARRAGSVSTPTSTGRDYTSSRSNTTTNTAPSSRSSSTTSRSSSSRSNLNSTDRSSEYRPTERTTTTRSSEGASSGTRTSPNNSSSTRSGSYTPSNSGSTRSGSYSPSSSGSSRSGSYSPSSSGSSRSGSYSPSSSGSSRRGGGE